MNLPIALLGFASGIAANNPDCALGPWYLYYHPELWGSMQETVTWEAMIPSASALKGAEAYKLVQQNILNFSHTVLPFAEKKQKFCVIGGDHSCAIATWSAVAHKYRAQGDIGLIWIDAHMDSHTPSTSLTQNIHGMPLAHLLGHGIQTLCQILDEYPKLKPEHLCILGVRSYEEGDTVDPIVKTIMPSI